MVRRVFEDGRTGVAALLMVFGAWYVSNVQGGLSIDEAFYATFGHGLLHGVPYVNPTHAFAPTGKYFVGIGQLLLGETSFGARVPIVLVGLATIYVTYRLGVELHGRVVGGLGAALLGVAHQFSSHAVMAVLDVPLTLFFLTLVLAALRWLRDERRSDALLIGVAVTGALTTKAYGFLYVAVPLAVLLAVAVRRYGLRDGSRALSPVLLSGGSTLAMIYLPFILVPHPPLTESYGSAGVMSVVQTLLAIPVAGNFVYIFGAAFVQNVLHLGGGHAVVIGSSVYQYPPEWAYLYWLATENGLFYLLALVVAVGGFAYESVRDRSVEKTLVGGSIVVPLVALSLLTVKFPRYVIPILPLVTVGFTLYLWRAGEWTLQSEMNDRIDPTPVAQIALVCGVLLLGVVVPPSAVGVVASEPIRTDTGYDDAVKSVEQYADDTDETVTVLTYHFQTFDYYFESRPDVEVRRMNVSSQNETYYRYLEGELKRGEIDLVVDLERNPRMRGTELYRYVRAEGKTRLAVEQADGRVLVVYEMPDD
jgi:4-amino-4-deoxy-L-arabinose transferase-like glycosyltransferase